VIRKNLFGLEAITDEEKLCFAFWQQAYRDYAIAEKRATNEEEKRAAYKTFCDALDACDRLWPQFEFMAGG
jgi:hypothetical protein